MLKVIIADDEEKVCWLIQKLIDWDSLGLELIGTVADGKSALTLIEEKRPDIVITDVRMPDMDGLQVIRATREAGIPTTFIVVSGHRQFEYAYSAIKYGVEDYLLKPIKRKEINSILHKIAVRMEQEQAFAHSKAQQEQQACSQKSFLHRQFMHDLLAGTASQTSIQQVNETYGFTFRVGAFYVLAAKVDVRLNSVGQVKTNFICEHIQNSLEETFSQPHGEFICIFQQSTVWAVLNTSYQAPHDTLREMLRQWQAYADPFECYQISLSLSDAVRSIADLGQAMQQARLLLGNRLFEGNRHILLSGTRPLESHESNEELFPKSARYEMRCAVESMQITEFRNLIVKQFDALDRKKLCAAASYYRLANLLGNFTFQVLEENMWGEKAVRREQTLLEQSIPHVQKRSELVELLGARLGALLLACEEECKQNDSKPIRIAKQYITTHYGESLTLERVASEAGLSTAYFSLLFKQETGLSFSDYVVDLRIKTAKDLLKQTDDTIASIAERVGYRDVKYFSRLFARTVGVNPAKYRKLHA